jgi:DNA-binding GntR family transcriptional regulator
MGTSLLEDIGQHKPIRDEVFLSLRKAILLNHFKPGERLIEHKLAQWMNVSRTPIREALRKLELEGLVDYVPRKGIVVIGISAEDAVEIYAICSTLEGLVARLAAKNRTDEELRHLQTILLGMEEYIQANNLNKLHAIHIRFHNVIARISKSPKLYQMIVSLREHVEHFTEASYSSLRRLKNGWKEHKEIVAAIEKGDAESAEHAARNHLMQLQEVLVQEMLTRQKDSDMT